MLCWMPHGFIDEGFSQIFPLHTQLQRQLLAQHSKSSCQLPIELPTTLDMVEELSYVSTRVMSNGCWTVMPCNTNLGRDRCIEILQKSIEEYLSVNFCLFTIYMVVGLFSCAKIVREFSIREQEQQQKIAKEPHIPHLTFLSLDITFYHCQLDLTYRLNITKCFFMSCRAHAHIILQNRWHSAWLIFFIPLREIIMYS